MHSDALREQLMNKPSDTSISYTPQDLLGSGSTLLNLNVSGEVEGTYCKGLYILFVGDSISGKTWLALTALAEATENDSFEDYDLIYDDVEDGALMSLEEFFGSAVVERLKAPSYDEDGDEVHSETIEDFYDHLTDRLDEVEAGDAHPFIYILDSMDALDSQAAQKKFEANKKKRRKGQDATGSYGDGKAKINSEMIRRVRARVKRNDCILIIICQTRDDINPMTFSTKTRSGGKALKFYAHVEIWTSTVKTDTKEIKGEKVKTGQKTRCRIKKNRLTGNRTDVDMTILQGYGVDDIGDNIDYLVKNKHWPKKKNTIDATEDFDIKATRAKLISHIEKNELEYDLQLLVKEVFDSIRELAKPKRKKRYGQ